MDLGQEFGRAGLVAAEIDSKSETFLIEPLRDHLVEAVAGE